ncbi:MAG TPA: UDP-N-acetylmuramoyl-tripeptide--D-alanyl-D-alanine ligase [Phycisphaerales bacterium]|nr:UDP-N-acetylmuramoyl-tripeptide--D-alanyl-D-alanine ligase [Phycisphaerales bacterium]
MTSAAHAFWRPESVRDAVGGAWLTPPGRAPAIGGGAAIDTRAIEPGQVFFALRGERTDGHRFLGQALGAGAAAAVIDSPDAAGDLPPGLPVLRVPDARAALGRLAARYRRALSPARFIAVTGSNGKTTTTRMIDACLRTGLRGRCSAKSFNNDLGVPLTILAARPDDQYVICEVGMNAPGEIEPLSAIIRPHVAVITSIGRAHLEAMGSLGAIAAEKAALASHLEPGGLVVLNADAPALQPWRERFGRVVTFGAASDAGLRVSGVTERENGISFVLDGRSEFSLPVLGAHNAANAAAAIAVARELGLADEAVRAALAGFQPAEMRLVRTRLGSIEIINDAYNANPDSMAAALRTLRAAAPASARRVAVLGDMLEMGAAGPDAHRDLGRLIAQTRPASLVILVGPLAALAAEPLASAGIDVARLPDLDAPGAAAAAGLLREGDCVLLKGSRGMRLERLLWALRERAPANA